jgi:hypothetical protein
MPDHLLQVDKTLILNIPLRPKSKPGAVLESYTVGQHPMTIQEVTMLKFKAPPSAALHWLPYIPFVITEAPQGSLPMLTGPMSGCLLVTYKRNGVTHFAHIGTEKGYDAENDNIRKSFDVVLKDSSVQFVDAFNPFDVWPTFPQKNKAVQPSVYALLQTTGSMLSIVVEPVDVAKKIFNVTGRKSCAALSLAEFKTRLARVTAAAT